MKRLLALPLVLAACFASLSPGAHADSSACPNAPRLPWMGRDVEQPVSIAVAHGTDAGEVFRPADLRAFPGRRPGVVIMHGLGGSQCDVWWLARDLAGHGYVALTFANSTDDINGYSQDAQDVVRFLAGPKNPYASLTDPKRLGASGHSQGAIVASMLQADPSNHLSAIVGLDNLHKYVTDDPGAALLCAPTLPASDAVTPRVPALGEAEDAACSSAPQNTDPAQKETGYWWWRAAGLPTMVVDFAGTSHLDWADRNGTNDPAMIERFAYYARAWFDRWLLGDRRATRRLLASTVVGERLPQVLGTTYLSGAFLPGVISTGDLRTSALRALRPAPPQRKTVHGRNPGKPRKRRK